MNKKQIALGLDDLITPNTSTEKEKPQTAEPAKAKANYKTYCYALDPEVAEIVAYIANYDRKKQNAVLTEAINLYAAQWTPAPTPAPRKFKK